MNQREAEEIIADVKLKLNNEQIWWQANGYLEALSQVEPLIALLRKFAHEDYRGNRSQHSVDSYEALKLWDAAQDKK